MRSTSTSRKRRGCFFAAFAALIIFFSIGVTWLILAISTPEDSPRARMFRTEADLRALMTAVETYRAEMGAFPPEGPEGLRLATEFLSRNVAYLPGGPPLDAWGNAYLYAPATAYGTPGSPALKDDGGFLAPDSYQLYSMGMDGDAGMDETLKRRDNIASWDSQRSWRSVYTERQKKFLMEKGRAQ